MISYHAVMTSETGEEFGADVRAKDRDSAYLRLKEEYPESNCVQLESPEDTARSEEEMWKRLADEEDLGYDHGDYEEEYLS